MDLTGLGDAHRRLVLTLLQHGPLQRRDLAHRLGLSGGSITRLTKPLQERGLVVATAEQRNAAGRPAHTLDAVLPADTLLGVSVSTHTLRLVRTDLRARVLEDLSGPLASRHPEAVVERLALLVDRLAPAPTVGIGIGVSGIVHDGSTVVRSPFLRWADVPLAELVSQRLGHPCVVANDVAAVALAEAWFGLGLTTQSFLALTFGTGVGGAAVVRGEVQDAEAQGIGLLGHLPLIWPDGSVRRANVSLTDSALVTLARGYGSAATTADAVEAGADAGARRAAAEFAYACGALTGTGSAFLVPDAVVVLGERAGLVAAFADDFEAGIASVREAVAPPLAVTVRPHNRDVWARGAAVTALVRHVSGL
ncbi:ROK family protein [Propioniciclava soli]|uniref:ROK family protein n=1 Tax=Propioniciclava soli TaxID=2775081 RepID=A0ABZ3C8R2_9ACTN